MHVGYTHMSYFSFDFGVVGVVQMKRRVMMDDVFIYRAHHFFTWCLVCAGKRIIMSTAIEHELTMRALESIHLSRGSNPALIPFPCFASNKLTNFSCIWFVCKHVCDVGFSYGKTNFPIFHMNDLCVATNMMNNCSFQWLVCNHNDILSMSCHRFFRWFALGVATKMSKTYSFIYFDCTHDDILDILHLVFMPNSPFVAPRMLTKLSFQCFACNNDHMVPNEIALIDFSNFLGNFVFPHFEDVSLNCLHFDLALASFVIYLCCANGVMNKLGHVIDDMLLYLAHTWFAWSLMCRSYLWMSLHELLQPRIPMAEDLARRAHQHLAKVTSFYISAHVMTF